MPKSSLMVRSIKVASGIGLLLLLFVLIIPMADKRLQVDAGLEHPARVKLARLDLLLEDYRVRLGKCPTIADGLDALANEYPMINAGSLIDPWGAKIAYVVSDDRLSCKTYSFGENGVDEKMQGDDISMPVQ